MTHNQVRMGFKVRWHIRFKILHNMSVDLLRLALQISTYTQTRSQSSFIDRPNCSINSPIEWILLYGFLVHELVRVFGRHMCSNAALVGGRLGGLCTANAERSRSSRVCAHKVDKTARTYSDGVRFIVAESFILLNGAVYYHGECVL